MAYNLAYQIEFENFQGDLFRVDLLGKNYEGDVVQLVGAEQPFILASDNSSTDDQPLGIQKALNATINYIYDGAGSLKHLYSDEDDFWLTNFYLVRFADTPETDPDLNLLQFTGYVVQDDCAEDFQDGPYIVTLSSTDNLGILKDVPYNDAVSISLGNEFNGNIQFNADTQVILTAQDTLLPKRNGVITVINSADNSNDFTIVSEPVFNVLNNTYTFEVYPLVKTESGLFRYRYSDNGDMFNAVRPLSEVIVNCLRATNLRLPVRVYWNIYENNMKDRGDDPLASPINQLYINLNSLMQDATTYIDAYSILENICHDFVLKIWQAEGMWHIMHDAEIKYLPNNEIPYTDFDDTMTNAIGSGVWSNEIQFGIDKEFQYINEDAKSRLIRPYKFAKATFNYNMPAQIVNNGDLSRLGAKIRRTVTADSYLDDYELVGWTNTANNHAVIRVVLDKTTELERERYIYAPAENRDGFLDYYYSNYIPVNAGDKVDFSAQVRSDSDSNYSHQFAFLVELYTATGKYIYRIQNGTTYGWGNEVNVAMNGRSFQVDYAGHDDSRQARTAQFSDFRPANTSGPITLPADGSLRIGVIGFNGSDKPIAGILQSFTFNYYPYISNSVTLTGQTHSAQQGINVKNKWDEEIHFDDSPKDILQGTLFVNSATPASAKTLTMQIQHHDPVSASFVTFDMLVPGRDNAYYISENQTWFGEGSFEENGVPPFLRIKRNMTIRMQGNWAWKMQNEKNALVQLIVFIYGQNKYVYFNSQNYGNGIYNIAFDKTFDVKVGDRLYFWYSCEKRRIIEVLPSTVYVTFTGVDETTTQIIKTSAWHRFQKDEALRIGQFGVQERLFQYLHPRLVLEGTVLGLKTLPDRLINLSYLIKIYAPEEATDPVTGEPIIVNTLEGYNFTFGTVTIDYEAATIECTVIEMLQDAERDADDSFPHSYNFNYLYKNSD